MTATAEAGMDAFDEYTNRVRAAVLQIPFVKTFGVYPEIPEGFETPAVFFEIGNWEPSSEVIAGSALTVSLNCSLYILREFAADKYGQKARNAALYMSSWIDGRGFGPGTQPATFGGSEPADWIKNGKALGSHSVWCVSFSQVVGVGVGPFVTPTDAPLLREVFVGMAPDVGKEHEADYVRVFPG